MADYWEVKLLLAGLLFLGAIVFSLAPSLLKLLLNCFERKSINKSIKPDSEEKHGKKSLTFRIIDFVNTVLRISQGFAAGVLLGGGLLHLIPESMEELSDYFTDSGVTNEKVLDYPWIPLGATSAMLFLYFFEKYAQLLISGLINAIKKRDGKLEEEHNHDHDHGHHAAEMDAAKLIASGNGTILEQSLIGLILWLSLAAHSVFAGMALGLSSDLESLWGTFIAIISHKLFAAYSLGIILTEAILDNKSGKEQQSIGFKASEPSADNNTVQTFQNFNFEAAGATPPAKKSKKALKNILAIIPYSYVILLLILFSLATPLGIIIGLVLKQLNSSIFQLMQQILMSFAAGAFLYVAIIEIMAEQYETPKFSLTRILDMTAFMVCLLIGFVGMAVLALYA